MLNNETVEEYTEVVIAGLVRCRTGRGNLAIHSLDLLRNYFRSEIMIFRAKTMKREEVNTAYSLTSAELFAAEKS